MITYTIQRLDPGARAAVAAHFLALPANDRQLRFGMAIAPSVIAAYVAGIDFVRDAVLGVRADGLALVGVAHVAVEDNLAELALSVLPAHRRRGVASGLFRRALAHVRNGRITKFLMRFRSGNAPIMRIARRHGMDIIASCGDAEAHLGLQPSSLAPAAVEQWAVRASAANGFGDTAN